MSQSHLEGPKETLTDKQCQGSWDAEVLKVNTPLSAAPGFDLQTQPGDYSFDNLGSKENLKLEFYE